MKSSNKPTGLRVKIIDHHKLLQPPLTPNSRSLRTKANHKEPQSPLPALIEASHKNSLTRWQPSNSCGRSSRGPLSPGHLHSHRPSTPSHQPIPAAADGAKSTSDAIPTGFDFRLNIGSSWVSRLPAFELEHIPSMLLVLRLLDSAWKYTSVLLGLQLADCSS
ncbi:uncharacterized protein AAG666_014204 [Megaptera novaeangliae]